MQMTIQLNLGEKNKDAYKAKDSVTLLHLFCVGNFAQNRVFSALSSFSPLRDKVWQRTGYCQRGEGKLLCARARQTAEGDSLWLQRSSVLSPPWALRREPPGPVRSGCEATLGSCHSPQVIQERNYLVFNPLGIQIPIQ